MPAATADSPWYKHLWPWIIIGILATSVCLSLTMVSIAVHNPDNLVNDNYYEAGKGINRSLDRELLAQTLNLKASVHLDELTGEVEVEDLESGRTILTRGSAVRPEYQRRIGAFLERWRTRCAAHGIDYTLAMTDTPLDDTLRGFLLRRRAAGPRR